MYLVIFQLVIQAFGRKEIVYSPARVPLAGLETVAPPGINAFQVGIKVPPGIGESGFQKDGEFIPFFVRESGVPAVGLRVLKVYLLVRHVHVAADDNRLFLVQAYQICPEIVFPLHSVIQSLEFFLGVRGIDANQVKGVEFQGNDPAFQVVLVYADSVCHIQRFHL